MREMPPAKMDKNKGVIHDIESFEAKMTEQINNAISEITQEFHESFQKMFKSLKNKGLALDEYMRTNLSKMKNAVEPGFVPANIKEESNVKKETSNETKRESNLRSKSKKIEENKKEKVSKKEEQIETDPSKFILEIVRELASNVSTKTNTEKDKTKETNKRKSTKEVSGEEESKKKSNSSETASNDENVSKRRRRTRNTSIEIEEPNEESPKKSDHESEKSKVHDQNTSRRGTNSKSSPVKETSFLNGDIVWAFWNHRWYAAKVCDIEDVPVGHKSKLDQLYKKGNPSDYAVLKFFVDGAYSKVNKTKLEKFGNTSIDEERGKGDKIYDIALEAHKQRTIGKKDEEKKSKKATQTSDKTKKKTEMEDSTKSETKEKVLRSKKIVQEPEILLKAEEDSSKSSDKSEKSTKQKADKMKNEPKEKVSDNVAASKEGANTYICGPDIKQNDLVIATVRGRKPWPAKVDEILDNGDCKVTFFATKNVNYSGDKVYPTKIVKYSRASKEVLYKQKSDKMKQAIEEISAEFSLL